MMYWKLCRQDLKSEKLLSFCVVFALAAVIAPLLLLFSLRYGVVQNMLADLRDNPMKLEIRVQGNDKGNELMELLQHNPDVSFIIPKTRSLNAMANLKAGQESLQDVTCYPTGAGDPILAASGIDAGALKDNEIVLNSAAAAALKVKTGDTVRILLTRKVTEGRPGANAAFTVAGITDPRYSLQSQNEFYVTLPVLLDMEDFRDGFEPEIFSDGSKVNQQRNNFASVRMYAVNLDGVMRLSKLLRSHKFSFNSSEDEIKNIQGIEKVLTFVFGVIAFVSALGGAIAAGGLYYSAMVKRTRAYGLMRLMGFDTKDMCLLLLLENNVLALLAFVLAGGLFQIGASIFNSQYSGIFNNHAVATLAPEHWALFFLVTAAIVSVISLCCAFFKFRRLNLTQVLRS